MKQVQLRKATYLDSISLMRLSKELSELPGIRTALVAMATDTNMLLLKESGFDAAELGAVSPDDMVIAIEATGGAALEAAQAKARAALEGGPRAPGGGSREARAAAAPPSAIDAHPEINLVLISTPGRYAAREAWRALKAGKHVMVFSDNVTLEDERQLKSLARERGLLLMGPDCGTAIIGGIGLGFANDVPRGRIGIVAASGTGAQEVSSILARLGLGVSHIIGTGGRDVSDAIGGVMTVMGLEALIEDASTEVLVIVSKLPSEPVAKRILETARRAGKPCVVYFAGHSAGAGDARLTSAATLTEAAREAVRLATGKAPVIGAPPDPPARKRLAKLAAALPKERRYLRGLFSGGTLAQEAVSLLAGELKPMHTNMKLPGTVMLDDPGVSREHSIVDLGDDAFTRGRAHPMIDQAYRLTRLAKEAADPKTAVIFLDVVLGYGCNADPAGEIAGAVTALKNHAKGALPLFVASVCGTAGDPQNYDVQRRKLEDVGVFVGETNALACELVREVLGKR
ncbi:MAG TPA: acyl-CoA synthetase FdrA [bacterium]|nr:acyl-CoA synthetase FdrA [bacterium]